MAILGYLVLGHDSGPLAAQLWLAGLGVAHLAVGNLRLAAGP